MSRLILSSAAALTLALTGVTVTPLTGQTQNFELRLGDDGPTVRMGERCNPRYEDCYRDDDGWYESSRSYRREMRRGCTEDRALDKAERMGLERVRIASAGRRTIQVRGRTDEGERARITFGRDWGCPVLG
jgi:hypothetical protein